MQNVRQGMRFDGVDDYVEISDVHYNNLSSGTIEAWVYVDDFGSSNIILAKQNDFVNTMGVLAIGGPGGTASTSTTPGVVTWHGQNAGGTTQSTGTLTAGQWHHVAVSFSGTQVEFYIDGVLDSVVAGNYSMPDDTAGTVRTTIGDLISSGSSTEAFGGQIADLRIWNVERTSSEIANNFESMLSSPGSEANLVGNWQFDTAAGGTTADASANGDSAQLGDATIGDAAQPTQATAVTSDSISLVEDVAFNGKIIATDNDSLTYASGTGPANGTLVVNADGTFTYTPNANYNGTDSFGVTVSDGTNTVTKTISVTVDAANDSPVAGGSLSNTMTQGGVIALSATHLNATDIDNIDSGLVYTVSAVPANGSLTLNGSALANGGTFTQADVVAGYVTYSHDGSVTTTDAFTFSVSDGTSSSSATTLNLTVNALASGTHTINSGETLSISVDIAPTTVVNDGTFNVAASATVTTPSTVTNTGVLNFTSGSFSANITNAVGG
ncbi:MAG: cadherin-like domain-containing protein [Magnetovibrio sp.]|nr:cadherin-like domain-containing protein [Magnetovibrio sp.]